MDVDEEVKVVIETWTKNLFVIFINIVRFFLIFIECFYSVFQIYIQSVSMLCCLLCYFLSLMKALITKKYARNMLIIMHCYLAGRAKRRLALLSLSTNTRNRVKQLSWFSLNVTKPTYQCLESNYLFSICNPICSIWQKKRILCYCFT